MEMTKGTQSKISAMMALGLAVSASAPLEANELRQLEAGLKTKKEKPNKTAFSWNFDMKAKHFTKKGAGRRHFGVNCSGYSQRNDKVGTTKLQRQLKSKSIYPPQKKHPFSSKK